MATQQASSLPHRRAALTSRILQRTHGRPGVWPRAGRPAAATPSAPPPAPPSVASRRKIAMPNVEAEVSMQLGLDLCFAHAIRSHGRHSRRRGTKRWRAATCRARWSCTPRCGGAVRALCDAFSSPPLPAGHPAGGECCVLQQSLRVPAAHAQVPGCAPGRQPLHLPAAKLVQGVCPCGYHFDGSRSRG